MIQPKKRDKLVTHKDTRWDRIRKRQQSSNLLALKTDAVRRLIECDYIGKHKQRMLMGDHEHGTKLNPSVVMDMRHQMFQKIPRKLPLATVANENNLKSCIAHNLEVEERFIRNELNKFRQQLERHHKRHELKTKPSKALNLNLDNTPLKESLASTSKHIEDFYKAPLDAMNEVISIYAEETSHKSGEGKEEALKEGPQVDNHDQQAAQELTHEDQELAEITYFHFADEETTVQRCRTPSPLTPTDEFFKPMRAAAERQMLHLRSVRLDEQEAINSFQRAASSCSNTSDGIESVISDLAEEVILELQMETQREEQEPKHVCFAEQPVSNVGEEECAVADEAPAELAPALLSNVVVAKDKPTLAATQNKIRDQSSEPLVITRLEPPKVVVTPKTTVTTAQPAASNTSEEEELSSETNEEHDRIIAQLFQARAHTNKTTLRKYFRMWIHYTTIERLERENCKARSERVHKINAFLDNIRKQKRRMKQTENGSQFGTGEDGSKHSKANEQREEAVKMAKQYKNKIKVQQDIIDLQRVKLERQERMIMELKLHKLTDEANEARQDLKQELKSFIRSGDPKSKAKAKCLQLIGNLRDAEDEKFARLQGKALLQPKFLQNMQERAVERSIRHEQARQRRVQADAEREAQKIAAEEAKRLEDEEAKRLRIEVLKEKRRQEKMAKIIKERERQRAIENLRKAKEFCRRLLLRRVGMEGFKRLLQRKHDNLKKCVELREKLYKHNCFVAWREYSAFEMLKKQVKAKDCHRKAQKRHAFFAWQAYIQNERSKMFVAIDWHSLRLAESIFCRWSNCTQKEKLIEDVKMRQAVSHHEWHLQWKVLDCWQRLPQILQLEKETEERRQRWRMKIWELLPDYKPNREDHLW